MEILNEEDNELYIHGMRKVAAHVGWAMCQTPTCNLNMPLIPSGMSIDQCISVIQAMELEVAMFNKGCDDDDDTTMLIARKDPTMWR